MARRHRGSQDLVYRTHCANPAVPKVAVTVTVLVPPSELGLGASPGPQGKQGHPRNPAPLVWGSCSGLASAPGFPDLGSSHQTHAQDRTVTGALMLGPESWGGERTELDKWPPGFPRPPWRGSTGLWSEETSPPRELPEAGGQAPAEVRESIRVTVGSSLALCHVSSKGGLCPSALLTPHLPSDRRWTGQVWQGQVGPCRWVEPGEGRGPAFQPPSARPWTQLTLSFCPRAFAYAVPFVSRSLFPLCLVKSPSAFGAHFTCHFLQEAFLDTQPSLPGPRQNGSHPCHSLYSSTGPSFVAHTCCMSLSLYLCGCLVNDGSSLLILVPLDLADSLAHSRCSMSTH